MDNPAAQLAALRRLSTKVCPHCGREFEGLKVATYCSRPCYRAAKHQRRVARNKKPAV